jgi:curved DNA-binding protein CbpA
MDPYKVLQVDPEAEDEVIQAAYRRLAQKYHPDVAGQDGAARMAALNAAWEVLRDPGRRAAHDRDRLAASVPDSSTSRPPGGPHPGSPERNARQGGQDSSGRPGHTSPGGHLRRDPVREPDTVSADWSSGRSTTGSGYDPDQMRSPDGLGAAGPPPGNPSGAVLRFGRYSGWSLGEIGRVDVDYLEWLDRMPIGRPYRDEIDRLLRRAGRRRSAPGGDETRRGLFRRR